MLIKSNCPRHGSTINALASDGKMTPVHLELPNGEVRKANSTLSALEYIKDNNLDRNLCKLHYENGDVA